MRLSDLTNSCGLAMTFGAVQKNALPKDIANLVLQLIRERKLRPGDKLPPERELAGTLQVSRPSLREALRALEIMNVVDIRHGSGTYVTSLEPELLVEHFDFVFLLNDSTYLELFSARKVVEVGMIGLAAEHVTDIDIVALEACLERSIAGLEDPALYFQADIELHDRIIAITGNTILQSFMLSIRRLAAASRRRTAALSDITFQTIEDHRRIIDALKARNPEAARQAMLDHLNNVEQRLKQDMDGSHSSWI